MLVLGLNGAELCILGHLALTSCDHIFFKYDSENLFSNRPPYSNILILYVRVLSGTEKCSWVDPMVKPPNHPTVPVPRPESTGFSQHLGGNHMSLNPRYLHTNDR